MELSQAWLQISALSEISEDLCTTLAVLLCRGILSHWAKPLWLMGNQRHDAKSNVHTMGILPARQKMVEFSPALVLVGALVEVLVVLVVQASRVRSQLRWHQVWPQLFGPRVQCCYDFQYPWWCLLVANGLWINAISGLVAQTPMQL